VDSDTDNDGTVDNPGQALPAEDHDGDGLPDYLDIDADDDGIVDNIEAQPTDGYVAPTGSDSDGDGLDDAYDPDQTGSTPLTTPENTDGEDMPDYLDLDSDNDGDDDALEGWDTDNDGVADTVPSGVDSDNDGLDDAYDQDTSSPEPTNGTTPESYPDLDNPGGDRDWREHLDPKLEVVKTDRHIDTNGNGMVDAGDVIEYTIVVTNTGASTLSDVKISDAFLGITDQVVGTGTLVAGASETLTFSYTLTQSDMDNGSISNTAIVSYETSQGDTYTNASDDPDDDTDSDGDDTEPNDDPDDPTVTDLPAQPSIEVTKSATLNDTNGNGMLDAGETISYSFTVTNTGNVTLTEVMISDPVVSVTGGPITLAPGESDSTTFTAVYTLTQSDIDNGSFTNQAVATGTDPFDTQVSDDSDDPSDSTDVDSDGDGEPDDPTVTDIPQHPSLTVTKVGVLNDANGNGRPDAGEVIEYTLVVTNTGNVTLTDVVVSDSNAVITGGSPITSLGPGESVTVTAEHEITQAELDSGEVVNQAVATGTSPSGDEVTDTSDDPTDDTDVDPDGDGEPDDETVTDLLQDPSLSLIKSAHFNDENGDGMAQVGETVTYSFTVTNTGNVTLRDITISDAVVTVSGGPISVLLPGESDASTFTATYEITTADLDRGYVENTAIVTGTDPNDDQVEDISDTGTDRQGDAIGDPESTETPDGEGNTNNDPTDDPTVIETRGIDINTIFTPNGDQVNDTWVVHGITHFDNVIEIYNRWGNLVYRKENYRNDWDGHSNGRLVMSPGKVLPAGTYYYIIDLGSYGTYAGYLYLNK